MMPNIRLLIIVLVLFSFNDLCSCDCVHFETESKSNIDYEIETNNWIGIGKITKAYRNSYPTLYEFEIRILYKGSNQIKTVQTGLGGPDCGFMFEVNNEYIIYGAVIDENTIETSRCTRTNSIRNSADYDYLNKKFKDGNLRLDWSESFTNFIQIKIDNQINIMTPPILVNENYKIESVEEVISRHPNYYTIVKINFNFRELKKMKPELRNIIINNGVIVIKPFHSKIRKLKLIKCLNRQAEQLVSKFNKDKSNPDYSR